MCKTGEECAVKSVSKKHFHLYNGDRKEVDSIQSCQCQAPVTQCQHVNRETTFYLGTEYETTVDLGMCVGPCAAKEGCLSLRTTNHLIKTPNGRGRKLLR